MKRTVYLNGSYLPEDEAKISIFDRAVLFGDAIYEVAGVIDGKLIDFDALMIDSDGYITECGATSFFIVRDDLLLTRPLDNEILPGVTRKAVIALCNTHGIRLIETRFLLEDALKADEAFISGASSYVLPVVAIDDQVIGHGTPGPWFKKLHEIYIEHARAGAI